MFLYERQNKYELELESISIKKHFRTLKKKNKQFLCLQLSQILNYVFPCHKTPEVILQQLK